MLEAVLRQGFAALELPLDERALERFSLYQRILAEENKVMNLTAITGEVEVARLHFLDCAALLRLADFSGQRVVDVGSGAGFPGLVLKIACPAMSLCLVDSTEKRVDFLRRLCQKLELQDVDCMHLRAEEAPAQMRESFDFALARAVARLELLSELCLPLVKPGGAFIAMKGPGLEEELAAAGHALEVLGGTVERIAQTPVPGTELTHRALIVRKLRSTPAKYPRRWAQMKKQPL